MKVCASERLVSADVSLPLLLKPSPAQASPQTILFIAWSSRVAGIRDLFFHALQLDFWVLRAP